MADLALTLDPLALLFDLAMDGSDLSMVDPLASSFAVSFFCWRRANDDDYVTPSDTRNGWWGDSYSDIPGDLTGSRIWLLFREKVTVALLPKVEQMAREATQWMLDDGVAARVDIVTELQGMDRVALGVTAYRADGTVLSSLRYDDLWSQINGG